MPFIQVSKKRRTSLPTTCRMMINPSTKSKNIDDVGVKRKASQDLIDYVTKSKRSKSEKKNSLLTVESEKHRKCEEIEVVAPPKKAAGDSAVNSSLQDLIWKAKLSKLGGDRVTIVDETEKLNKEHLRKEKIEKERDVFRTALDKMKPITELFEDNLSVMKEFETSYGLRYFDSQSHEQFVRSKLYDCTIKTFQGHSSWRTYSNPPTKLKNFNGIVERKASRKLMGDEATKTKHKSSNPPTQLKKIDGSVKKKASQKLTEDETAKTKRSRIMGFESPPLWVLRRIQTKVFMQVPKKRRSTLPTACRKINPLTKPNNIDVGVKRKASQDLVDCETKIKRSKSEFTLKKKPSLVPIASENPRKCKEKETATPPKQKIISVEKAVQVCNPKKSAGVAAASSSLHDLIFKEKLAKLGVDGVTTIVNESEKLKKEHLRKEKIEKEREASRIALDNMKSTTELFEDNISTMKEFEETIELRYFNSESHGQFTQNRLYLIQFE